MAGAGQSYLRPFTKRVQLSARASRSACSGALSDFGAEQSFARCCERLREHLWI